ncbi:MAG: aminoacyl-histidine dipeptidase [Bacteroidales bacterium]
MHNISDLQPKEVWEYMEEILSIPRISKHEAEMIAYLEGFAGKHRLEFRKDAVGNVLIRKGPTQGMEDRKGIILQSHMDMVGEKNADVHHDFLKDPIRPRMEEGWVRARGTTLGADDGIGISASLAVLASDRLEHGPLECLFTVDEESGMTGAFGLQPGFLNGRILLNLDSEDEGEIFVGCAGGMDTVAHLKLQRKRTNRTQTGLRIFVGGLKGGHSGDEIHKGLGNSVKILNRFLWNADRRFKIHLAGLTGGKARNAIPREAEAILSIPVRSKDLIAVYFDSFVDILRSEMKGIEPGFFMKMEEVPAPEFVIRKKQQRKILNVLYACPSGVISMSQDIPGLVETSTNLAAVRMPDEENLEIITSQRSSVESAKRDISDRMAALFTLLGARVIHSDGYPGWKPEMSSEILGISRKAYKELFRNEAAVKAIHAGLECGLFLQKYPDLDMISFGPTIKGAHTPEEGIEIATVQKFWDLLLELLRRAPVA